MSQKRQKQEIVFQDWDETHHQLAKKSLDAERMKEISKNAELIHEMSMDFNSIVHEQEECLDLMEEETEKAKNDLKQANVDLKKAKQHQNSAYKSSSVAAGTATGAAVGAVLGWGNPLVIGACSSVGAGMGWMKWKAWDVVSGGSADRAETDV